jgi:23S rRNA pseudouridine1911/1915/1917 synthase
MQDEVANASGPLQWSAQPGRGLRLDRFLTDCMKQAGHSVSRTRVQDWIRLGAVRVNEALCSPAQKLSGRETLEVWPQPLEASNAFSPDPIDLTIAHLDEQVMVVDKPAGLVVHPAPGHWRGTLMNGLLHWRPALAALPRAGIVHRLDRDTSGLLMIGLEEESLMTLQACLAARLTDRVYLGLVHGDASRLNGLQIDVPIGRDPVSRVKMACHGLSAKTATTAIRFIAKRELASGQLVSLLSCKLETGRTHQIRVHLGAKGFPLVGDPVYGRPAADRMLLAESSGFEPLIMRGQALHASMLQLPHPKTQHVLRLFSPPPWDLDFPVLSMSALAKLWDLKPSTQGLEAMSTPT